jgi:Fungal specific transcription factor domain
MKRMQNTISIQGNPIFDPLSRKHYPQILQIGNENGDLPIVEMLGPHAFELGGQYFATDGNGSQDGSIGTRSRRDSRSEEATETEIILESLLSLGASNALEIEQVKHQAALQASMFHDPSSTMGTASDRSIAARSEGTFTPDNAHFDNSFASPYDHNSMAPNPMDFFEESFMHHREASTSIVHRSLPPIAPPGISTENERKFLHHYLHVISARITSPDRGRNNPFRNSFARLATDFPPLLHGILAISAADLARYDRGISAYEAFLHYQGCVSMLASALNEPTTIVADEALATICLLFLHEVLS